MAISRLCSIPDCGKPATRRGWCEMHYKRWCRHGDPLGGRAPNGEPQRYFREVVLPYDGDECLIWPFWRSSSGYAGMAIGGRTYSVSRLVCKRAHGPPPTPKHEAAHSCGKGHEGCVTKRHLRWATKQENEIDKLLHGTSFRGDGGPFAKLTEDTVHEIRRLRGTIPQRALASRYGVTKSTISDIHLGKTWAWLG